MFNGMTASQSLTRFSGRTVNVHKSRTRMKSFQREGLWQRTQLFLTSRRGLKKKNGFVIKPVCETKCFSWQQDRIWHHCLWIRMKKTTPHPAPPQKNDMREAARRNICILTGSSLWSEEQRSYRRRGGGWGTGGGGCTLMHFSLGLGDSADDAVQEPKVLWTHRRRGKECLLHVYHLDSHTAGTANHV